MPLDCTCIQCGKQFRLPRIVGNGRGKFCSRECYDRYHYAQVECICRHCNKKFSVHLSRTTNGRKYCSQKCHAEAQLAVPAIDRLLKYRAIDPETDCWNWTASAPGFGYGQLGWNGKRYLAHRLSFMVFNDVELTSEQFVLHKCDNPRCFNPEHLFLGTQQDNIDDAWAKGRMRFGERHPNWGGTGKWANDYDKCVVCGTTEHKHHAYGHCRKCRKLRTDEVWSPNYDRCISCGTTDRRHNAHGLCSSCYKRKYREVRAI